jgi:hypothetical protein
MMDCEIGGRIDEFPLVDMIQMIHLSRRTGCLTVRGPINGMIEFRHGRIVRAKVSSPYADIGTILMDHGSITKKQLVEAVRVQRGSDGTALLGRVLVELGHTTVEQLREAMRAQVDQVVQEMLGLEKGNFIFRVTGDDSDDITQDVSEVLVEASVSKRRQAG